MPAIPCADMTDRLMQQRLEEAPRERKTRLTTQADALAEHGMYSGVSKLYEMEDGRIYAEYNKAHGGAKVMYTSRDEATSAFTTLRKDMSDRLKAVSSIKGAGETGKLPPTTRTVDYSDLDPTSPYRIDQLAHGEVAAGLDQAEAYFTGKAWAKLKDLGVPRQVLNAQGPVSREFVRMAERQISLHEQDLARSLLTVEKASSLMTDEEYGRLTYSAVQNGEPLSDTMTQAYKMVRGTIADRQYRDAQALGLEVAPPQETYWPRVHNARNLASDDYLAEVRQKLVAQGKTEAEATAIIESSQLGMTRGDAVKNIMQRHAAAGNPIMESEAKEIIDRHILPNAVFRSGHLEKEVTSAIPPIEDFRISWSAMAARNSRRLAQAAVWGPNYEKYYAMLDAVKVEGGKPAFEAAQKVGNLLLGREQNRLPEWLSGLMDWQSAKLSTSVIANLTQVPLNVPMRVGIGNTVRGVVDFLRNDKWFKALLSMDPTVMAEHAREAGAIIYGAKNDILGQGMPAIIPPEAAQTMLGRAMQTTKAGILDASTRLFEYVETANRAISVRAGERYFEQQVERLAANPEDSLALRRLQEAFPSPRAIEEIMQRATNGDHDGMLDEFKMLMGKRISDQTQFKSNALTRPLFSESPAGAMLYQFKQFSMQQAEFMARELTAWKHDGDLPRTLRAIALPMVLFPAVSVAAIKSRQWLMGESITSQKLDAAFRDPTFVNIITAGTAAILTTGTIGIMGDAIGTAMLGNRNALNTFLQPPVVSTFYNTLEAAVSPLKAMYMGDYKEIEKGIRAASREFGGIGATIVNKTMGPAR